MTDPSTYSLTLEQTLLKDGVWEGTLSGWEGDEAPMLYLMRGGEILANADVSRDEAGTWSARFDLPGTMIGDGAQAFSIVADGYTIPLLQIALLSGDVLKDDLYADVALLRDEIEVLKKSFRGQVRWFESRLRDANLLGDG